MSVSHRSIARLPLEIFENLSHCMLSEEPLSPEDLRVTIVKQLKKVPKKKWFRTVYVCVSTVGPLLRLPLPTLMRALDPLLTYGTSTNAYTDRG
jgi:hypothetical protein